MKIIVCIKQVPDIHCQISPNEDGLSVDENAFFWTISPEDECVVEQALQIKEQVKDCTVVAIRIGVVEKQEALVSALAMGVDDAVLVNSEEHLDPYRTAKALAGAINNLGDKPDLIFCGNISYDSQNQQVPQLLAQMLDLPAVTHVTEVLFENSEFKLAKFGEGGRTEYYLVYSPVVIACSYGITEPRYAPLPHIKRAEKKAITKMSLKDVGVNASDQRLRYKNYRLVNTREQGRVFHMDDDQEDKMLQEVVDLVCDDIELFQK